MPIASLNSNINRTLLQSVQAVCRKLGLTVPASVVGSNDPNIVQMYEVCNEAGQEYADAYEWQILTAEVSFLATAVESQGSINTIVGGDLGWIVNDTIWNRTTDRPMFGPLSAQQWQQIKANAAAGPFSEYRIRGNELLFYPAANLNDACYFEWVSKDFCQNTGGSTSYCRWNADTDVFVLDSRIFELSVLWKWKQLKGLDFQADYAKYLVAIEQAKARDGTKTVLSLSPWMQSDFLLTTNNIQNGNFPAS
jgi:hypothetical protein